MTGGILVIQFRQPVDIPVDRLGSAASEYTGAARRDPDGRALRFALAQKVRLSSMTAATGCSSISCRKAGPASRRACRARWSRNSPDAPTRPNAWRGKSSRSPSSRRFPPIRVRVAGQPTFTRYVFELPELTGVTAERGKDKLTLTFARSLRFDLSDAKLASAKAVAAVEPAAAATPPKCSSSFRNSRYPHVPRDSNYVVDVSPVDARAPSAAAAGPLAGIAAPETIPAQHPKMPMVAPTTAPPAAAMPKVAADEAGPAPAVVRSRRRRLSVRRSATPTAR